MRHGRITSPGPSSSVLTVSRHQDLAGEDAVEHQDAEVAWAGGGQLLGVPRPGIERVDGDAQVASGRLDPSGVGQQQPEVGVELEQR